MIYYYIARFQHHHEIIVNSIVDKQTIVQVGEFGVHRYIMNIVSPILYNLWLSTVSTTVIYDGGNSIKLHCTQQLDCYRKQRKYCSYFNFLSQSRGKDWIFFLPKGILHCTCLMFNGLIQINPRARVAQWVR